MSTDDLGIDGYMSDRPYAKVIARQNPLGGQELDVAPRSFKTNSSGAAYRAQTGNEISFSHFRWEDGQYGTI